MSARVVVERRGDVAVVTLCNPDKRNALTPAMCDALREAAGAFAGDGVRAAVLTGEGDRAFCAGFDVTALPGAAELAAIVDHPFDPMIEAVARTPVPIVAALNGPVHGGGLELAASCDLRVAHAGVRMSMPPAKLGIVYATRGLARFAALVGESRARDLFFTARTLDAAEAERWGLIDRMVDVGEPARVVDAAVELAEHIAALAPLAVQGMKRAFQAVLDARVALPPEVAAELERERVRAWTSADAAEARAAFAGKRAPRFRGE